MNIHDAYLEERVTANAALARTLVDLGGARVLITGASGIVGFAVAKVLRLSAVDLVLHSRSTQPRMEAEVGPAAQWIHGPLTEDLAKHGRFDLIFHCATYGQPQKFSADWRETIRLNIEVLFRLLDMTRRLGFASTTEVYSGLTAPATEAMVGTTTPQHPRSTYIEAKRLGESICFHSGIAVANRIALASGPYPRLDDSRALYQIIRRAEADRRVKLMGGSGSIRQYQYSLACALRMIVTTALGTHPVYNNAGPYVVSMEELGRLIASRLGVEYIVNDAVGDLAGAPGIVRIDTGLAPQEFPQLADIDPSLEFFIDAVIEATHDA